MNQCEVVYGTCGRYRNRGIEESKPWQGRRCVVEKERGETICHAQQYGNTGKERPVVLIGISILRNGSKVEGVPSEERGCERRESGWYEEEARGGVEEGEIIRG